MCVSAEASFGLAAILAPVGVYCVKVAVERDPAVVPLALIPLLFGVQQIAEGFVWVGIGQANPALMQTAAFIFLFFALAFWPFWIPLSTVFLESRNRVKIFLGVISATGLLGGLFYYLPLMLNPEVVVINVIHHSIRYDITLPPVLELLPEPAWHLCYLAVVTLPLMIVARNRRGLLAFSIALVFSAMIGHAYFWYAFASVWCFFAAILSLILSYMFYRLPSPVAGERY